MIIEPDSATGEKAAGSQHNNSSTVDAAENGHAIDKDTQCYQSAFRGREIHGTPLLLPKGWTGVVLDVPQSSGPSNLTDSINIKKPATAAATQKPKVAPAPEDDNAPDQNGGLRRSPRKKSKPPGPAVAKRFKVDSDSDSDSDKDDDEDASAPQAAPPAPIQQAAPSMAEIDLLEDADDEVLGSQANSSAEAEKEAQPVKTMSIVGQFDRVMVWSPDGPVDRGDDVFFRALTEWQNVVIRNVSSSCEATSHFFPLMLICCISRLTAACVLGVAWHAGREHLITVLTCLPDNRVDICDGANARAHLRTTEPGPPPIIQPRRSVILIQESSSLRL